MGVNIEIIFTFDDMEQTQLERILVNAAAIRKITVGDPLTGMKFIVGNEIGRKDNRLGHITKIVYDQNSFYTAGVAKYIIYIHKYGDPDESERVYKFFENQPVAIELIVDE